jgi:undecaprenyl-diphosphatase
VPLLAISFYLAIQLNGNFHVVTKSRIYRSAQLDSSELTRYIKRYHIKSILNLRGSSKDAGWYQQERRIADRFGIAHFDCHLSASEEVFVANLRRIINLIKMAPKPILIHCRAGADRTGLIAATWKLAGEGEPRAKAYEQLSIRYGHVPGFWDGTQAMDRSFWSFARSAIPEISSDAPLDGSNVALFKWIRASAGRFPFMDGCAVFFAVASPYILIVLFATWWFCTDVETRITLLEAMEACIVALLVNQIIGLFFFHPRPYMMGLGPPLLPHAAETSFPSDHATLLFAAAIYLWSSRIRLLGLLLLLLALANGWGRVYSGIHFPFDILGSLVVAFLGVFLIRRLKTRLHLLNGIVVAVYDKSYQYFRGLCSKSKKRT